MSVTDQTSGRPKRPAAESGVRWPIRWQLLIPLVSVVLLASLLGTAITAHWIALRVRKEQEENLRRVVKTLGEAAFPLTRQILVQMRGLSGAEFVLMGSEGALRESTLPMSPTECDRLLRMIQRRRDDAGTTATVFLADRTYLSDFVQIERRSHFPQPATLFILYPEDELTSRVHQAVFPALSAGFVAALVAVAMATWLAQRFARPIHRLGARTAAIAQGDFTPMPLPRRNDELRDLAESINRMTGQLADYEERVRHNERLRTVGQLGASMAHQLRNAATGGRMAIELHCRECPRGEGDESLDVALRQLRLMESYLRQFLSLEEPRASLRERLDLVALGRDVLGLLQPTCQHAGVTLVFSTPSEPLFLRGDPSAIRQLVTNLALNAIEAAVGNPTEVPRVWVELDARGDRGFLRVQDTGPGPDASVRDRLFSSFVTTKPAGFGLGLYVAHQIAERHGGRLSWERVGSRTLFQFEFPLISEQSHGAHPDC